MKWKKLKLYNYFYCLLLFKKKWIHEKMQSCKPCCAWLATFQLAVISGSSRSIDVTTWDVARFEHNFGKISI